MKRLISRCMVAGSILLSSLAPAYAQAGSNEEMKEPNSFAFKLFKETSKEKKNENFLVSPFSVSTALTMTYLGAVDGTKQAMSSALGLTGTDDEIKAAAKATLDSLQNTSGGTKLEIANALFASNTVSFKEPFIADEKKYFDAGVQTLDFSAADSVNAINGWVSEKTHEKIPTIIDSISPDAILYLINAIYFKGTWKFEFDKEATREEDFNLLTGSIKVVPMMHQSREDFRYMETAEFQAVSLRFKDDRLSLCIFLPVEGKTLDEFEAKLTPSKFNQWVNQFHKREGYLSMPRFKLEDKMLLKEPLSNIGMEVAFNQSKADFSNMAKVDQRIFISQVFHKTFMEVNEEGAEAAAATAVEMSVTSAPMNPTPPFTMAVDRPFFFALRDNNTGALLFTGHIVNP